MIPATKAPFLLCMERWVRVVPWAPGAVTFTCQFVKNHDDGHSWEPLQAADKLAQAPPQIDSETLISAILAGLASGVYDPYLESILAVGHERKRVLRGVRTFHPDQIARED